MTKKRFRPILCLPLLAMQLLGGQAGNSGGQTSTGAGAKAASSEELQELRKRITIQEEQIKKLQQSIDEQRSLLESATGNAGAAASTPPPESFAPGTSDGRAMLPVANSSLPYNLLPVNGQAGSSSKSEVKSPLSFKIGNATFTPLGFVDFTFFERSTNVGSGIGTSFGSLPFNTGATGRIAEGNFSAQNSRIGLRIDSTVLGAKVLGYLETDFLGNNALNFQVTSNSDSLRLRNYFVDIQKNGFEILAGQDWSMLTPNRKGLSPIPADIFYTQNMDTNYQVGLTWSRQPQVRFIAHPTENFAFGVSLENPQQFVPTSVVFPAALAPSAGSTTLTQVQNEFTNGNNTSGTSTPNLHPDIIAKAAYDGHVGDKTYHVEVAGLVRGFKYFNNVSRRSFDKEGFGGSINSNLELFKGFHLVQTAFASDGGGRYIFGLGPDVVLHGDGSLGLVHSYSGIGGFEYQATKNTMVTGYYGGAYFNREVGIDTTGKFIGYGFPGSANSANKSIQEGTFGLVQTLWKDPSYGALQLIGQYSYVWRTPWEVATGAPKNARTNMYYLDLRYTIP